MCGAGEFLYFPHNMWVAYDKLYMGELSVTFSFPFTDHKFNMLSFPPEANILPSGDQASPQT